MFPPREWTPFTPKCTPLSRARIGPSYNPFSSDDLDNSFGTIDNIVFRKTEDQISLQYAYVQDSQLRYHRFNFTHSTFRNSYVGTTDSRKLVLVMDHPEGRKKGTVVLVYH